MREVLPVNDDAHEVARILRYMASVGDITEADKDTFKSNNVTEALAIEGFQGGVHH